MHIYFNLLGPRCRKESKISWYLPRVCGRSSVVERSHAGWTVWPTSALVCPSFRAACQRSGWRRPHCSPVLVRSSRESWRRPRMLLPLPRRLPAPWHPLPDLPDTNHADEPCCLEWQATPALSWTTASATNRPFTPSPERLAIHQRTRWNPPFVFTDLFQYAQVTVTGLETIDLVYCKTYGFVSVLT